MKLRVGCFLALLLFFTLCLLSACQRAETRFSEKTWFLWFTSAASTEQRLAQTDVPASDPRDLAVRLRPQVDAAPLVVNSTTPAYAVGDQLNFWVTNLSTQQTKQISAELVHKTAVAYAWVEVGPSYNPAAVIRAVDQFSTQTYPAVAAFFGSEWRPGVDNDPRLHVLYTTGLGDAAGSFGQADEYSRLVNPYSNEKEMFYISLSELGDGALLAHEFQHMIHWRQDSNEATWVDEGLSEYAQEMAGFGVTSIFVNDFLNRPDTPLTAWEEGAASHYGASYLFIKYLHQRFGPALLRTLVAQPGDGAAGVQQAFARQGVTQTFDALFADWVVANYANQPTALGQAGVYGYAEFPLRTPSARQVDAPSPDAPYQATVHNYATDYLRLRGQGAVTVQFAGQTTTQLAPLSAHSGRYAWWSNRGDRSDSRLTRRFDLRSLAPGAPLALEVAMWWAIEEHYDYGYVLASRDGRKWQILPGQQTTTDNPAGHSFGPAYTGEPAGAAAGGWVVERFDLSPYAGEAIWLRFEYVTDDAINDSGWFIDDVRIAGIGYASDFEHGPDGWQSEGWLLTDNQLAQRWLLQVLAFEEDALVHVRRVTVDAAGRARVEIPDLGDGKEVVLAVSALAPATTAAARYEVEVRRAGGD